MIVVRVSLDGQIAAFTLEAADGAVEELQAFIDHRVTGSRLTFELVEMSAEAFDALPEFDGWR